MPPNHVLPLETQAVWLECSQLFHLQPEFSEVMHGFYSPKGLFSELLKSLLRTATYIKTAGSCLPVPAPPHAQQGDGYRGQGGHCSRHRALSLKTCLLTPSFISLALPLLLNPCRPAQGGKNIRYVTHSRIIFTNLTIKRYSAVHTNRIKR